MLRRRGARPCAAEVVTISPGGSLTGGAHFFTQLTFLHRWRYSTRCEAGGGVSVGGGGGGSGGGGGGGGAAQCGWALPPGAMAATACGGATTMPGGGANGSGCIPEATGLPSTPGGGAPG
jgi:hypothetical protein